MKRFRSKKVINIIIVLVFIFSSLGNISVVKAMDKPKINVEKTLTSPLAKQQTSSSAQSKKRNILAASFEITSLSDFKTKSAYILNNRLTDVDLHITYSFGDAKTLATQIEDLLFNNPPVDDYVSCSITNLHYAIDGYDADCDVSIQMNYVETKTQAQYVESDVQKILPTIIKDGMSDLDKEKAIHDYIVSTVAYDESLTDHSAYGALVNHTTVCQGYALLTYKMLMDAKIEARIVISNDSTENGHAWNMAKINGAWYHLDCTFDDPVPDEPGRLEYTYFNKTDAEMAKDHKWDRSSGKYPIANTEFDATVFEKPSIDSVTLKNAVIDVETSNIKDNTSIKFSLVNEDGSDTSKASGEDNLLMLDDESEMVVSEDGYAGGYFIPEYVPEGNYKIKVTVGSQTAYSNVISVKRDSEITISNLKDGYKGKDFPSALTGSILDKDGISYSAVYLEDADYNYVDLTSGEVAESGTKMFKLNSDGTFSQDIPAFNKMKDGEYALTIMTFDSNGIETSKTINFTKDSNTSAYDWQKVLSSKPWKTKYSSATELNTLMNVAVNKKFTVKFSSGVDFSTLNSSNVEIVDAESGQVVLSTVNKVDSNTAQVVPSSNLTAGRVYYIVVNNNTVKSSNGKNLKNIVVCPVKVADN